MKSITNIFKNKIVVAVICFVIAMIIAFIIVPSKNHDGERVNVIKVTKTISANTKITDDMLKEVNVEYDSVPSCYDSRFCGRYACANTFCGSRACSL